MRVTNPARLAVACLMAGALACASNTARVDDETAAAQQDTTNTAAAQQDTSNANAQTPPGYSGMERDTAMAPDSAPTAIDTFLNEQGTGVPTDTQGYGGLEHPDTSAAGQTGYDTTGTGQAGYDTTGAAGQTGYDTTGTGQTGFDTTSGMGGQTDTSGMSQMDTTGMGTSQDTTR
jgi:hypothetical protein